MIGKQVSHYRILELLGEGGMASVYRAEDLNFDRIVAIKVIRPTQRDAEIAKQRFLREAEAVSKIDHPNVVTLLEVFEQDGAQFMVMQYIEGETLFKRLERGPIPVAEALTYACQIAAGLEVAHRLGVVHRDLKPENVMLTAGGQCKILDFGVARLVERSTITEPGRLIGTARYMAPEQIRGEPVDARTDVYALGAVLYEMVAGKPPFDSDEEVALFYQITNVEAAPIRRLRPEAPEELERIVHHALQKRPADRFAGAAQMLHDLEIVRMQLPGYEGSSTGKLFARGRQARAIRRAISSSVVGLILLLAFYLVRSLFPDLGGPPRIMVTKWEYKSPRRDLDWLPSGIMDCMVRALGGREGLDVISRETVTAMLEATSPQAAGPVHAVITGAASKVGANYLVSGDIETGEATVRVNCELTDLRKGILVKSWSKDVTDMSSEFYPAIEEFAANIAAEIGKRGRSHTPERKNFAQSLTSSIDALTFYLKAVDEAEMRNVPAALDDLRRALALDSTFVEAHRLLANLTPERGETEKHLAQAMEYRFRTSALTRQIVEADNLSYHDQSALAIRKYEEILTEYPEEVPPRIALAGLYMYRRRFADACAEYGALHRISPYDFSFYRSWTTAYVEIGRDDKAHGILADWHRQFPGEQAPLRSLIQLEDAKGEFRKALALCDSLDQLQPGATGVLRAFVFYDLGRLREAEGVCRRLQNSPDRFTAASRGTSFLAFLRYEQQRYAEGLDLIATALRGRPEPYDFWIAGMLAAASGDTTRAWEDARGIARDIEGGERDSTTVEAYGARRFYYHLRGVMALKSKDPRAAVRLFDEALRYASRRDSPYFRTSLGDALIEAGNTDRAIAELKKVLDFNANAPEALLYLGRAYVARHEYARAREVLRGLKTLWRDADIDYPMNQELSRLMALTHSGK